MIRVTFASLLLIVAADGHEHEPDTFQWSIDDYEYYETVMFNIIPIPLTEGWLLKFGAYNSLYMRYLDFGYFDIYKLNEVWYVEKEGVTLCELKYVHQFQNLYFALTGEELTIKQ